MELGTPVNTAYEEARAYLYSFVDYERNPGWKYDADHFDLDRVVEYLTLLGSPHRHGRYVHVAGTNGKGSVSAIIAKALSTAGVKTGLYTSPHLVSFRERIRIDGCAMSRDDVVDAVARIRGLTDRCEHLTFFEVWTALAFDYFRYGNTDISVVEVGMGGRLDTTNVITPDVSVITSISMDHAGTLGSDLQSIAREKGGIIKTDKPVVIAPQKPEALEVLMSMAAEKNADVTLIGRDVHYEADGYEGDGSRLSYRGRDWMLNDLTVPLPGEAQCENAALAVAVLEQLSASGLAIDTETVRASLEAVRWPGRLQTLRESPRLVVDGACNEDAANVVCKYLSTLGRPEDIVMLVAMNRDKKAADVLRIFAECASRFVLTRVDNPRMQDPAELAGFLPTGTEAVIEPDCTKAIEAAGKLAGNDGIVAASGSLYLVGDVMRHYGYGAVERI